MIKVDDIYLGQLTGIVGPAGTIRRLLLNREYFLSENVDITVFNHGKLIQEWNNDAGFLSFAKTTNAKRHKLRQKLDTWARKSLLLSIALMEYRRITYKKELKAYLELHRTPDAVVFHSETEAYFYLKGFKGKLPKTACFFHSDGIPLQMYYLYYPKLKGSWYAKRLEDKFRYVVEHVDKCVFICKAGKTNLNRIIPASVNNSFLVINGIDDLTSTQLQEIDSIRKSRKDSLTKLISVGSVSVRKGQRLILEALSRLSEEERQKYNLTIVGGGPDLDYCKDYAAKFGLNGIVVFTGAVPNTDVFRYLAKADVFVLMSNNEGLPISIIEAMRAGLAVLSTNVSGIPELVEAGNGVLVEVSSESLYSVLNAPHSYDWKAMGKASRLFFEQQYRFERMRSDYVSLINSMTIIN